MPQILIVEDEIADCDAMAEILGDCGYATLKAHTVDAALAILEETTPDIILSDTMMPAVDGGVLMRIARGDRRLRKVPFVTVSAKAMATDKAEAFAAGASGFIPKPFTAVDLLAEVMRQLARKSA